MTSLKALLCRAAMSCTFAAALCATVPASANTLQTIGWVSPPPDTFTVHRGATSQNVYTGGFTGVWNLTESIFFWCFDLDHYFQLGHTYTNDYVVAAVSDPLNTELRQLFEEAFSAADDSPDNSAAFQLAIWNLLYDNDLTVSSGSFWANNGHAGALTQANAWLVGLSGYTGNGWSIRELLSTSQDPRHQSFVVGDHPPRQDVPEPSSLPLCMLALCSWL